MGSRVYLVSFKSTRRRRAFLYLIAILLYYFINFPLELENSEKGCFYILKNPTKVAHVNQRDLFGNTSDGNEWGTKQLC